MDESPAGIQGPTIIDNSLYRRLIIRPLATRMAPILIRLGFSGDGVCWLKMLIGLAGAVLLTSRSAPIGLLGMLLLQMNFFLDAVDGEVARLKGQAGWLSGEYLDKLFDHLPKTAMYFFWGYGTHRLAGSSLPLFCGTFFAAWNIYPRFCGIETLLERLDKAPEIYHKPSFQRALAHSFSVSQDRGRADFILTILIHPAMNLLTLSFLIELLVPEIRLGGGAYMTRFLCILLFTFAGGINFIRKSFRFYRLLRFS